MACYAVTRLFARDDQRFCIALSSFNVRLAPSCLASLALGSEGNEGAAPREPGSSRLAASKGICPEGPPRPEAVNRPTTPMASGLSWLRGVPRPTSRRARRARASLPSAAEPIVNATSSSASSTVSNRGPVSATRDERRPDALPAALELAAVRTRINASRTRCRMPMRAGSPMAGLPSQALRRAKRASPSDSTPPSCEAGERRGGTCSAPNALARA